MYRPSADDFDDFHVAACSAEPMRRADHKAKKHGRPRVYRRDRLDHHAHRARIDEHNAWAALMADGGRHAE
ncbi:hypothetical protein CN093_08650 [Sinorhizobium meliloti]|uniref:hypothetical protein n=1 Tax=Rhizobium meliloti TaxID=382 RepID=UPI000FD36ECE|nr:hypothetical protein [Sinorhizobium meliloti]RVO41325.1 hypothetical protein CN093_08650 [Sinorhizobium meliloti]